MTQQAKHPMSTIHDYDQDLVLWTERQARLLREGKLDQADIKNIAEELESMGRSEKRELRNRLRILLMHLLKWSYQPNERSRSWAATIRVQRDDIESVLEDNPSLRPQVDEFIARAYGRARAEAAYETRIDEARFPQACPWAGAQVLDGEWLPE